MTTPLPFQPLQLKWSDFTTYFLVLVFAAGNLILPQLCHLIPSGGLIFLPIYFFTLIAAYKFGMKVGLATALLSPLANSFIFGMPPMAFLPVILIKSCLLAIAAASIAEYSKKISIFQIVLVVLIYQLMGSSIEWMITQNISSAVTDLTTGIPGMLIQVFLGWYLLKKLSDYEC